LRAEPNRWMKVTPPVFVSFSSLCIAL